MTREQSPDYKFARFVEQLDDDKLGCRAENRHRMPRLKPGRLPKNVRDIQRKAGGIYEIEAVCSECGMPGTLTTGRGGTLSGEEKWKYDYSQLPGYLAPAGSGRGRRKEYAAELGARLAPDIRALAARKAALRKARPA